MNAYLRFGNGCESVNMFGFGRDTHLVDNFDGGHWQRVNQISLQFHECDIDEGDSLSLAVFIISLTECMRVEPRSLYPWTPSSELESVSDKKYFHPRPG